MLTILKNVVKKGSLYIFIPVLLLYCIAPLQLIRKLEYTNIDLSYDRSLCGKSPLPFWFTLTQSEIDALQNSEKAKTGDPVILLSLALIASGNVRKAEDFKRYHNRMSQFVDAVRPVIENADDFWQKGNLLYTHMRKEFLVDDSSSELAGYEFGQSQLSVVFEKGTYNCISSGILYTILGRWFDMQVDGVLTRGHAFVQLTAPDGKKLELETTSRNGFDWIHIIDLDAAMNQGSNIKQIKQIIKNLDIKIQVGGGIRDIQTAFNLIEIGVSRIILGTALVKKPDLISILLDKLNSEQIVAAIDYRKHDLAIEGWTKSTGIDIFKFAQLMEKNGAGAILFTSIEGDGTLLGPDIKSIKQMIDTVSIPVIAAGGIGSIEHLKQVEKTGVEAVVIGKAIYEGKIDLNKIKKIF